MGGVLLLFLHLQVIDVDHDLGEALAVHDDLAVFPVAYRRNGVEVDRSCDHEAQVVVRVVARKLRPACGGEEHRVILLDSEQLLVTLDKGLVASVHIVLVVSVSIQVLVVLAYVLHGLKAPPDSFFIDSTIGGNETKERRGLSSEIPYLHMVPASYLTV